MAFDTSPGEILSRFLSQRDQFRNGIVRHTAFSPPRSQRLSVYWISNVPDLEIWSIGNTYVAPARGPILGCADLNSLVVYENNLAVEVTGEPHPRHADIINWDTDRRKARLQATKLADRSILVIVPPVA